MNSERFLREHGDAVGLFRGVFKAAIDRLIAAGVKPREISSQELIMQAQIERENRKWYFENDDITYEEVELFEDVMNDYLQSFIMYISDLPKVSLSIDKVFDEIFN